MKGAVHAGLRLFFKSSANAFNRALENPEQTQLRILRESLKAARRSGFWNPEQLAGLTGYADFRQKIPVTDFSHYEGLTQKPAFRADPRWSRWEPTSGSTQARKWIPYNTAFLRQLHRASSPWLSDLYEHYPGIRHGSHYWSLSWLPQELRDSGGNDDSELLPFWERGLLQKIFPVPASLTKIRSFEGFWRATLTILAAHEDLSLISVWSPTFLRRIFEDLEQDWPQVHATLSEGRWAFADPELSAFPAPRRANLPAKLLPGWQKILWPQLALVSAWDSSSSRPFAEKLKETLAPVAFQGKGLWATEGVITIPYRDRWPLAVRSHFYEFRCRESDEILSAGDLRVGQNVKPLITAANGLLRYELDDLLLVTGHLGRTPCFEFQGRDKTSDLVGEKLDFTLAAKVLGRLQAEFSGEFLTLQAQTDPLPHYILICLVDLPAVGRIAERAEQALSEIHHYRLARELGQLGPVQVRRFSSLAEVPPSFDRSQVLGQNKIETLIAVSAQKSSSQKGTPV